MQTKNAQVRATQDARAGYQSRADAFHAVVAAFPGRSSGEARDRDRNAGAAPSLSPLVTIQKIEGRFSFTKCEILERDRGSLHFRLLRLLRFSSRRIKRDGETGLELPRKITSEFAYHGVIGNGRKLHEDKTRDVTLPINRTNSSRTICAWTMFSLSHFSLSLREIPAEGDISYLSNNI